MKRPSAAPSAALAREVRARTDETPTPRRLGRANAALAREVRARTDETPTPRHLGRVHSLWAEMYEFRCGKCEHHCIVSMDPIDADPRNKDIVCKNNGRKNILTFCMEVPAGTAAFMSPHRTMSSDDNADREMA